MTSEVDSYIQNNFTWANLPKNVKQLLGNSQREYEKMIYDYSVKNQLRYKGNLIRQVRKNEEQYYEYMLQYSRNNLMLYPYHLSDIVVKELRTAPFHYYCAMMQELMAQEKSYDSLPNFTAQDCHRLLGIDRNKYIEMMNQCRATKKAAFGRGGGVSSSVVSVAMGGPGSTSDSIEGALPRRPQIIKLEPWWIVQVGYVMENDIKLCTRLEKDIIDMLIDEGGHLAAKLDKTVVQQLYQKGLVYFDVPVQDSDHIALPPLDAFIMNRVLGDYFETLLYKIFVAIDDQTPVGALAEILTIDSQLVKNAVSVFLRLGMASKRITGLERLALHVSWADHHPSSVVDTIQLDASSLHPSANNDDSDDEDIASVGGGQSRTSSAPDLPTSCSDSTLSSVDGKRLGFVFDSTLTAFLMMGNLSNSLKKHAVTLFEVGKLTDEALDNFVSELENVKSFTEGEAQRYFEHSQALRETIQLLRNDFELDLIRCESLMGLDRRARLKILSKNYQLLVTMAPLTSEVNPINCSNPPCLGPPICEANSPWFRLFLYELVGEGPTSMLLTKGTRLRRLPTAFSKCRQLLLCTWSHEPGVVVADACLPALNDALQSSAVFLQAYSSSRDGDEVVHIPFPIIDPANDGDEEDQMADDVSQESTAKTKGESKLTAFFWL